MGLQIVCIADCTPTYGVCIFFKKNMSAHVCSNVFIIISFIVIIIHMYMYDMYPVFPLIVLVILVTCAGCMSHIGNNTYHTNLPFLAATCTYTGMVLFLLNKKTRVDVTTNIWYIFIAGLFDCATDSLLCLSFKYTSISSVSLLLNL